MLPSRFHFSPLRPTRRVAAGCAALTLLLAAGCKPTPPAAAAPAAATAANAAPSAPAGATPAAAPAPGMPAPGMALPTPPPSDAVPVEVAAVARGPISAFLSFNSTLETEAIVDVYPQASGQVETLFAEEGRIVKQGEPLLKIEDAELKVDADEAQANFDHLQKGFSRIDDLFQRKLINQQDYDDNKYQLEQARLRLERTKLRLAYATVRAPFDGVISSRDVQVGARVSSGTKLFSMVKLDEIVARVFIPGRYLPVVAENQAAVVTSEFLPDRNFKGWVKRISPVIDPKSGTFKVTVGVRGEKPSELPPGLFVNVRVITDTKPAALLIPKRAVVYEGGERYVFSVVNDRAVKRKIAIGYEDPQNVEALSGFEVGAPVIVLGHNGLKDGALVRTVNALSGAPALPPPATNALQRKEGEAPKAGE